MTTVIEHFTGVDEFDDLEAPTFDAPRDEDLVPSARFVDKSHLDKALHLMSVNEREKFRGSPAMRSAALTYASLEQAAAADRQTAVLERQAAALEKQNELTAALLDAQRISNQLAFYAMGPDNFRVQHAEEPAQIDGEPFRESVFTQMKRLIGIMPARPRTAPLHNEEPPNDFE